MFTAVRSLYDAAGSTFVAVANFRDVFTSHRTLVAIRNNAVWVAVAPVVVTFFGLVFAVLSERIRWATAFKTVIFMPMAISFLAAGVIFRLAYETNPERGVINAVVAGPVDLLRPAGRYTGAAPRDPALLRPTGPTLTTAGTFRPGEEAGLPFVGLPPRQLPQRARQAVTPVASTAELRGVVWLDFALGGGGEPGVVDRGEKGLPGMRVEAVRGGHVVATATADDAGRFAFPRLAPGGPYRLRLSAANFRPPYGGVEWLGPALVTSSIIGAYLWIWAGFAMVVIAAGLAAIPREALEAARVDGANEWQVFRRVTVPLLAPVLLVVVVTLVINVLKIFDLVLIIPPGSVQADANVLALEMWRVSFGGGHDQGVGSALALLLFVLVLPAMAFNIRRLRAEAR